MDLHFKAIYFCGIKNHFLLLLPSPSACYSISGGYLVVYINEPKFAKAIISARLKLSHSLSLPAIADQGTSVNRTKFAKSFILFNSQRRLKVF